MYEKPNLTPVFVRLFVVVLGILLVMGLVIGRLNAPATTTTLSLSPAVEERTLNSAADLSAELFAQSPTEREAPAPLSADEPLQSADRSEKRGCGGDY